MNMTNQASDVGYKANYNNEVLGKPANDPAIAYPEYKRLKKIHDDTTKSKYQKEAKEVMKKNIYPPDAPEFLRALESAKNASDVSKARRKNQLKITVKCPKKEAVNSNKISTQLIK